MYSIKRVAKGICWLFSKNPAKRRRMRQEFARIAASLFGDFPISDDYKLWREDKDFLTTFKKLSPLSPYTEDRKFVIREFVRHTNNLDGVIAECGCFEGASAYFIAEAAMDTPIYLFDSFEGLSTPSKEDSVKSEDQMQWGLGDMRSGEKTLSDNLSSFTSIHILKGWIPSRFKEVENKTFRFVHIDVDLYKPTMDCLQFFYPRLVDNGVVLMDDYGSTKCPGAYKAAQEYFNEIQRPIIHLPTGQGLVIKN